MKCAGSVAIRLIHQPSGPVLARKHQHRWPCWLGRLTGWPRVRACTALLCDRRCCLQHRCRLQHRHRSSGGRAGARRQSALAQHEGAAGARGASIFGCGTADRLLCGHGLYHSGPPPTPRPFPLTGSIAQMTGSKTDACVIGQCRDVSSATSSSTPGVFWQPSAGCCAGAATCAPRGAVAGRCAVLLQRPSVQPRD